MRFEENEIVLVKNGPQDQGHGNERGVVVEINPSRPGIFVANYSIDMHPFGPEAEAYRIGFPPEIGGWKTWGWYTEDELEKID